MLVRALFGFSKCMLGIVDESEDICLLGMGLIEMLESLVYNYCW